MRRSASRSARSACLSGVTSTNALTAPRLRPRFAAERHGAAEEEHGLAVDEPDLLFEGPHLDAARGLLDGQLLDRHLAPVPPDGEVDGRFAHGCALRQVGAGAHPQDLPCGPVPGDDGGLRVVRDEGDGGRGLHQRGELLGALAKRPGGGADLGHVLRAADLPHDASGLVALDDGAILEIDPVALLVAHAVFDAHLGGARLLDPRRLGEHALAVVGMDLVDPPVGVLRDFVRLVPEHLAEPAGANRALGAEVEVVDDRVDRLGGEPEPLVADADGLLGEAPFVHVLGRAAPPHDAAGVVARRDRPRPHPPERAVGEADAVLDVVRLAARDRARPGRGHRGQVGGMRRTHPPVAERLLAREAGEGEPSLAEALDRAVHVRGPRHLRIQLHQGAQVGLALAECGLRLLAGADVAEGHGDGLGLAELDGDVAEPAVQAVRRVADLDVVGLAGLDDADESVEQVAVGAAARQDVEQQRAVEFLARASEDPRRGRIHVAPAEVDDRAGDVPNGIEDGERVGRELLREAEEGLAGAQRSSADESAVAAA